MSCELAAYACKCSPSKVSLKDTSLSGGSLERIADELMAFHTSSNFAKLWAEAFHRETEELRIAQQRIVTIEVNMQGNGPFTVTPSE